MPFLNWWPISDNQRFNEMWASTYGLPDPAKQTLSYFPPASPWQGAGTGAGTTTTPAAAATPQSNMLDDIFEPYVTEGTLVQGHDGKNYIVVRSSQPGVQYELVDSTGRRWSAMDWINHQAGFVDMAEGVNPLDYFHGIATGTIPAPAAAPETDPIAQYIDELMAQQQDPGMTEWERAQRDLEQQQFDEQKRQWEREQAAIEERYQQERAWQEKQWMAEQSRLQWEDQQRAMEAEIERQRSPLHWPSYWSVTRGGEPVPTPEGYEAPSSSWWSAPGQFGPPTGWMDYNDPANAPRFSPDINWRPIPLEMPLPPWFTAMGGRR